MDVHRPSIASLKLNCHRRLNYYLIDSLTIHFFHSFYFYLCLYVTTAIVYYISTTQNLTCHPFLHNLVLFQLFLTYSLSLSLCVSLMSVYQRIPALFTFFFPFSLFPSYVMGERHSASIFCQSHCVFFSLFIPN